MGVKDCKLWEPWHQTLSNRFSDWILLKFYYPDGKVIIQMERFKQRSLLWSDMRTNYELYGSIFMNIYNNNFDPPLVRMYIILSRKVIQQENVTIIFCICFRIKTSSFVVTFSPNGTLVGLAVSPAKNWGRPWFIWDQVKISITTLIVFW